MVEAVDRTGGPGQPAPRRERRTPGAFAREAGGTLAAWAWGQLLVCLILTALYAAGFAILRVPFWFLLAPFCGFLNLIPHFGPLIALITGALVVLIAGFGWARFAEVIGVYVVVFALEGYWLTPRILGRRLKLRPLCVFLAVLLGGSLFGFVGLLLAVPVLAVGMAAYRFFGSRDIARDAERRPGE